MTDSEEAEKLVGEWLTDETPDLFTDEINSLVKVVTKALNKVRQEYHDKVKDVYCEGIEAGKIIGVALQKDREAKYREAK